MIVGGSVRVPGDKSITHRALLLSALARGTSRIGGALTSLDARSTARVLRRLGAEVTPLRQGATVTVTGGGARLRAPSEALDCGNSGTTCRLLLGLLAAQRFSATLTGDASLRRRPMRRVTRPLSAMGARFDDAGHDGLPLTVRGGRLQPLAWELPVASAQLKSALLLAGVAGGVPVELTEPAPSRDHTERMLRALGYTLEQSGGRIVFRPDGRLTPLALQVPGDFSSAMFLTGAAILAQGGELRIEQVGVNPTRTAALAVLGRMGATVQVNDLDQPFGEPIASLVTGPAQLVATEVKGSEVPGLIDEIPLLAVLASRAQGTTMFRDVGELRVKESDRLALLAQNLSAVGARAVIEGDDLLVTGGDAPPRGRVTTAGDHRIAMAFTVLGTVPGARITVDDPACAAVSFPGFATALSSLRVT